MNKVVKDSGPTTLYGRQIVYDREIFISICRKKWLVQNLVLDRKVIRPDQVCPELAQYLPAIAEAAPTVAASAEAPL